MAKKAVPTITYTEILSYAYACIDRNLTDWRDAIDASGLGEDVYLRATEDMRGKADAIAILYKMETGNEIR